MKKLLQGFIFCVAGGIGEIFSMLAFFMEMDLLAGILGCGAISLIFTGAFIRYEAIISMRKRKKNAEKRERMRKIMQKDFFATKESKNRKNIG